MAPEPGTQLGHYEILSAIGKGGMGEVWKALDRKLGREVAIKTLPPEFAQDPDRLARFGREARLLASLNHPHIAAIYGLEEHEGSRFLVLELVEGDTLADRLKHGAIPVEEALKLALQIVEALEAAHGKGVIHRDLKPANMKITADDNVKVLDFGLAKAFAGDAGEVNLSSSPTLSMTAAEQGIILGTAAYMSPEQARGRALDKRTDIWAIGCVLYEMLTGRQVFAGEDVATVLARVVDRDPDFTLLPANLDPGLRKLLSQCLEKDVGKRYHDVADLRLDIEKVLGDPAGLTSTSAAQMVHSGRQSKIPWAVAFLLGLAVATLAVWNLKPEDPVEPRRPVRFSHVLGEGQEFTGGFVPSRVAIAEDGSRLVFVADGQLYVRAIDALDAYPVPGTDGDDPATPFFSPDGESIGYWSQADLELKRIPVGGGTPQTIFPTSETIGGTAHWSDDDRIVWVQDEDIVRATARGGEFEVLVPAEDRLFGNPETLPDGKTLLFQVGRGGTAEVVVQSLDSGVRKTLFPGVVPRYLPAGRSTGYIVHGSADDVLIAVPFDLETLELLGPGVPVEEGIGAFPPHFDLSDSGALVYLPGVSADASDRRDLLWVPRDGSEFTPAIGVQLDSPRGLRLSPDGRRVALATGPTGEADLWIYDLEGRTGFPLAREGGNGFPVWMTDRELVFRALREGVNSLLRMPGVPTAQPTQIYTSANPLAPLSFSPEGELILMEDRPGTGSDIVSVGIVEGGAGARVVLATEYNEEFARLSPNGRWLAYATDLAGESQIWVQQYPEGAAGPVSGSTGTSPVWSRDSSELFYIEEELGGIGRLMSVRVTEAPELAFGPPELVLDFTGRGFFEPDYEVTPDGERFLMLRLPDGVFDPTEIRVVVNWDEAVKERVPLPPGYQ